MFARRLPIHWDNGDGIACGAALTKSQHEARATRHGIVNGVRRYVTCPRCIAAIRLRIRQLLDPATVTEEAYARSLGRMLEKVS